ncbi:ABC transporter ATP-binding protein, partial [Candidatus Micrarchaeota archaeon]|nr:ABC transporter ATP-binding protein [Candidatus Micrarchaeota archaeon]
HMIGLLDKPTNGSVYIEGRNATEMKNGETVELRRKKIGFVFQQFNLIKNLNVYENVAIPLALDDVDEDKRKEKVIPLLKRLGLLDRMANYPNQISGGQMQRVAIARALILNPDIVFADEPTGNLDSKSGEAIMKIFKEMNAEGKTIVMITHDKNIAKNANKIVYMKDGKVEKIEVKK